ncbi:MAG: MotA/TolQ/ExbB proton channel family protein [Planctomycetales bacterium]|nr:MotA/TolQ/ExbB proton channel family protein [Planctomycetales bacterium]
MSLSASGTLRRVAFLLAVFAWISVLWSAFPNSVSAQEDEKPAAAAAEGAPAKSKAPEIGFFENIKWLIHTSGAIGAFIFLLSVYFIATVSRLFIELKPEVASPPQVVEGCKQLLEKRDFKTLYSQVKADKSFFSTVVTAGMAELSSGLEEARDAMERVGEALTVEMEKKISMLAVLGSLGPMIGLLGTLKGMIASFSVIAMSDTSLKASEVAGGISEALVLTFEGVALSVPAIYFFAVFRNRVSSISVGTMLEADEFVRRMAAAAKAKGPAPAAPTQQVAAPTATTTAPPTPPAAPSATA